jgi:small-conductance mechanosensitive channel
MKKESSKTNMEGASNSAQGNSPGVGADANSASTPSLGAENTKDATNAAALNQNSDGFNGSTVQQVGAPDQGSSQLIEFFNPNGIPYAIGVIFTTFIVLRVVNRVMQNMAERMDRQRLSIKKINTIISFLAYLLGTLLALTSLFKLSSQAIFALSGTMAVTVGFALKDVAASFLAGISILTNKPFQVGDRIAFGEYYGEVKEIGLRTVRLVTLDDNLVTIPSNKFLTQPVASANAGKLDCMVVTKFFVSPQADHSRAKAIVRDAILASKFLYLGKPFTVLTSLTSTPMGHVMVELTGKAYVYDTRHEKAFASDITERVLDAFKSQNIEIPAAPSSPAK